MLPPLFNPSNDMALAANVRQYFPPRHIQQMEEDLASVARLWDEGPWGWSLVTRQHYLRMGIDASELPSDEWLGEHRRLSSREFCVGYYRRLSQSFKDEGEGRLVSCQASFCTSLNEVSHSIIQHPASIIKAPWSSSGRGNVVVNGEIDSQKRRIERIIREQGGIAVEPFYENKTLDFAMEFNVADDETRFLGYSVFSADETGHYGGNYVKSQEQLLQLINVSEELLGRLIAYHKQALGKVRYRGPVGIDMMRLADGRVHPCVEINFRMTMGLLAIILYNKGMRDDQLLAGNAEGFSATIRGGRLNIVYRQP